MLFKRCLLLGAASALALMGCSTTSTDYAAPPSFTATEGTVTALVAKVIDNSEGSPGLVGQPSVRCFYSSDMHDRCGEVSIRYTVKEPAGIDYGEELVKPTRQIWKALFEDPKIEGGRVEVEGPTTSPGGIKSTSPLYILTCTREDAKQIDWGNVDAHGLKTICKYQSIAKE